MKKLLSKILIIVMTICMINGIKINNIFAEDTNGKCGDSIKWTYDSDTETLVVSGEGEVKDYFDSSYYSIRNDIKYIKIENGITNIADGVFSACLQLTSVSFPNSLKSIGNNTFSGCSNLTNVIFSDSITTIGNYTFSGCSNLINIILPDSITNMGYGVFCGCSNLKNIKLSNNLTNIYSASFSGCINLTNISIPESVKDIAYGAFSGCYVKKDNIINQSSCEIRGLTVIDDEIGGVCIKDNKVVYARRWVEKVDIPNSIINIESYAFSGCDNLMYIEIPESVTDIGSGAFSGCYIAKVNIINNSNCDLDGLTLLDDEVQGVCIKDSSVIHVRKGVTDVEIPNTVTNIENDAFKNCNNLRKIVLPESLTTIGEGAFYNCSSLESITIPKSVTSIGKKSFYRCENIKSVIILGQINKIYEETFEYCRSLTNIELPESLTSIGNEAFYNCGSLVSIIIPEGVVSIGKYAFYNCRNLISITIPQSVTSINKLSFYGCDSLKTAGPIGSGCDYEYGWDTSIPSYAFANCVNLKKVTIPKEIVKIGDNIYYGCKSLKTAGPIGSGCDIEFGWDEYIPSFAFKNFTNLVKVIIPEEISNIEQYALDGCSSLKTAGPIGSGCNIEYGWKKSIPNRAFYGCDYLTEVIFSDSLTNIGSYAFYRCRGLTDITIPNNITKLGSYAFDDCTGLVDVKLSDNIINIEKGTFQGCRNLANINIPNNVTSIGDYAFRGCLKINEIVIPNKVTRIGSGAFNDCVKLEKITLDDNVLEIGSYAFAECESLQSIYLSKNIIKINEGIFSGCKSLNRITIPENATSIGRDAFSGCINLANIIIPNSVTKMGIESFIGCFVTKDNFEYNGTCDLSQTGLVIVNKEEQGLCIENNRVVFARKWIETAEIPENITSIGWGAFRDCNLKDFYIHGDSIDISDIILPEKVTIHCDSDSKTYWYAKNNGYNVITFDKIEESTTIQEETKQNAPKSPVLKKQTIKTAKIKKYKAKKLKNKRVSFKLQATTTGDGRLCYYVCKSKKSKYITVNKLGKVTLKKGIKKGIYKIKIVACKTKKYYEATKIIKIKVK